MAIQTSLAVIQHIYKTITDADSLAVIQHIKDNTDFVNCDITYKRQYRPRQLGCNI